MATTKKILKTTIEMSKLRVDIKFMEAASFNEGDVLEIHIRPDPDGGFLFPEFILFKVEEESIQ